MAAQTDHETGLTDQRRKFADEYLVDFNASAAYQRAGYKAKGNAAHAAASRLLADPKVQGYLQQRKAELSATVQVDQQAVLMRLVSMAMGDSRQLFDEHGALKAMHDMTPEQAALIQGIEVFEEFEGCGEHRVQVGWTKKVRLVPRLDAVKLLGVHFGMFAKKFEHAGKNGGPIMHNHALGAVGELLDLMDGADTGIGPSRSRSGS